MVSSREGWDDPIIWGMMVLHHLQARTLLVFHNWKWSEYPIRSVFAVGYMSVLLSSGNNLQGHQKLAVCRFQMTFVKRIETDKLLSG